MLSKIILNVNSYKLRNNINYNKILNIELKYTKFDIINSLKMLNLTYILTKHKKLTIGNTEYICRLTQIEDL